MAERTTIARPYADAAFGIAKDTNALADWSAMLALAKAVAADAAMAHALENPKLGDPGAVRTVSCGARYRARLPVLA